jgi:catechol 2,3-dioxygenase-like lactoylglutathione lyase family enzyme
MYSCPLADAWSTVKASPSPTYSTATGMDVGWTHVALYAHDLDASIDFYARYARMGIVHSRKGDDGKRIVWLSDRTRPFALVLIESREPVREPLGPWAHLGVGLPSREAVDERCALAREEGHLKRGPVESGYPVGYWALLGDPDGHTLEISFGQEIGMAIDGAGG